MTYRQGCIYAAYLGIPCLVFDLLARIPPMFHMPVAHRVAEILLFPGWQVIHAITGGLVARNFEYKFIMPLVIITINILAWGAVVYAVGNLLESRRQS